MKKGVMVINTSRGGLVKTQDIVEGLKSGQIGAFGMDVYQKEKGFFFMITAKKYWMMTYLPDCSPLRMF